MKPERKQGYSAVTISHKALEYSGVSDQATLVFIDSINKRREEYYK